MLQGLVDLIERRAFAFEGPSGDQVTERPLPSDMERDVELWRSKLVEAVRSCDVLCDHAGPKVSFIKAVWPAFRSLQHPLHACGSLALEAAPQIAVCFAAVFIIPPSEAKMWRPRLWP